MLILLMFSPAAPVLIAVYTLAIVSMVYVWIHRERYPRPSTVLYYAPPLRGRTRGETPHD